MVHDLNQTQVAKLSINVNFVCHIGDAADDDDDVYGNK